MNVALPRAGPVGIWADLLLLQKPRSVFAVTRQAYVILGCLKQRVQVLAMTNKLTRQTDGTPQKFPPGPIALPHFKPGYVRKKERNLTLLSVITGTSQPLSSPGADDQSEGLTRDLSTTDFLYTVD